MASAFFAERALNQPILLLRSTVRGRNGYLTSQLWHRSQYKGAAVQRNHHSQLHGSSSNHFYSKYNYSNSNSNVLERFNRHRLYARSNILLLGSHHRGRLATLSARGYSTAAASQADETGLQHLPSHSDSLDLQHLNILAADTPLQLSNEQKYLLRKVIDDKKSVFFTGSAGTGKSVLLRQLIQDLKQVYKPGQVAVTASTGIAACNIGGCTLHSFAGVGLASGTVEQLMVKLDEKKRNKARWRKTKVLIIDEISMVDGALFDKFEEIARRVKKNDKPFGGIQLIVTGDFFQLPPVANTSHTLQDPALSPIIFPPSPARASLSGSRSTSTIVQRDSADYLDHYDEVPYFEGELGAPSPTVDAAAALIPEVQQQQAPLLCFDAKSWKTCIEYTLQLTEVFRQRDQRFINMLTEMRHGKLSDETCRIFKELERTPQNPDDGIQATELFALRREVETANHRHLADLAGPVYVYQPHDHGPWKEVMDRVCIAPTRLQLKENAQVMLIKNLTPTLVNGSMGVVVGFHKDNTVDMKTGELVTSHFPVVRFVGEEDDLVIRPEEWRLELPDGEVLGSRIQVPLILSWAMSIHKSQGQTIERLKVDMGKIFEVGQAYVAISRATTLEGLQVVNFNKRAVLAHDRVGAFYDGLVSVQEMMNLEKQVVQEQLKLGGKRRRSKKSLQAIEAAAYEALTASRAKQVRETLTENSGIENQRVRQEPIWREDVEESPPPVTAASLSSAPTALVPSSPPTPPVSSTKTVPSSLSSAFKATEAVLPTAMCAPVKSGSVPHNTARKSKPVSSMASMPHSWPTLKWLQQSPSASSSAPKSLPTTATRPRGSSPSLLKSTSSARLSYSGAKSAPSTTVAALASSTANPLETKVVCAVRDRCEMATIGTAPSIVIDIHFSDCHAVDRIQAKVWQHHQSKFSDGCKNRTQITASSFVSVFQCEYKVARAKSAME
ncbi:hypothetical protein KVV02_004103 [Mortierella alpina]|uniref:ATP-dependent DNA helicase PIF1 n=1 Tax=Mortierella alpina TaxID=64518 RepID=A0A9P8CZI0_MORAP|nr:hypothetical protein KVV02_004103 [Mortierella alpina]